MVPLFRILAGAATLVAVSAAAVAADPVSCTSDSVRISRFSPCTVAGTLLSNLSATVGGVDVSNSDFIAITRVPDNAPHDFNWFPLVSYPVAGEFEETVDSSSPLVLRYDLTALESRTALGAVDMGLTNLETGFHSLVETLLDFEDGTSRLLRMGWEADGTFLGDRSRVEFPGARSMAVQTRIYGPSIRGGGGVGLFSSSVPVPAPVPEPGTVLLIGSGFAFMVIRMARR
jgi:hypothetical protein